VHTGQKSGGTAPTNFSVPTYTIKIVKNSSGYNSVGWECRPKQSNLYWCHLPELSYNFICLIRPYQSYCSLEVRFTAFRMTETHHAYRHAIARRSWSKWHICDYLALSKSKLEYLQIHPFCVIVFIIIIIIILSADQTLWGMWSVSFRF
jgi:hypothetical protein